MAEKVTVNSQMAFSSGVEVVTDDFVAQMGLVPVKVEPPDEEPIEPQIEFHPRLEKEEIITDDVPHQMNLTPIPMKLVEAATGKQIQCQPGVSNADCTGEADASSNQEPLVVIKQEPDENVSDDDDDDCSHEMPYCPTELVQTSFGTYDMPESFKSDTEEFRGVHRPQRSSSPRGSSTKRSRRWRARLSQEQREEIRRQNRERDRLRRGNETEEEHRARLEAGRVRYHAKRVKCEIKQDAGRKSVLMRMRNEHGGDGERLESPEDGEGEHQETQRIKLEREEDKLEHLDYEEQMRNYASGDPGEGTDLERRAETGTGSPVCYQNVAEDGSSSDETYDSSDTETEDESESDGEAKSFEDATPALGKNGQRGKRKSSFGMDTSEEKRVKKERDKERKREARSNETPVQRENRLQRIREYAKNKRRSETMEETEMRLLQMRKWAAEKRNSKNPWKYRTTEQGAEGSEVDTEGGSSGCATGTTPDGCKAELGEGSESNASTTSEEKVEGSHGSVTVETEEERLLRLKEQRERKARRLANETAEQRQDRLENVRERKREKMEGETAEQREARLKQLSAYVAKSKQKKLDMDKLSRIVETTEERRKRLENLKTSQKKHLAKETPEQRRNRLEKMKAYQAKRLENETPEERENRLMRARKYSAQRDERLRQMKRGNKTSE